MLRSIAYIIECHLIKFNANEQLELINEVTVSSIQIELYEKYQDNLSFLTDKRPQLDLLLNSLHSVDLVIIPTIYNLGIEPLKIIEILSQISERSQILLVKENISLSSSAQDFIKVAAQLKKSCKILKFKQTLNAKKICSKKENIGRPPLSSEIVNEVIYLKKKGLSYGQIVRTIGFQKVSKSSISRILKKQGINNE